MSNISGFGLPVVVAINHFTSDAEEELAIIEQRCAALGVKAVRATHWAHGGAGTEELARVTADLAENTPNTFDFLYPPEMPLWEKVRTITPKIHGANDITANNQVRAKFNDLKKAGFGRFMVCLAKTQYSFSTDPALCGSHRYRRKRQDCGIVLRHLHWVICKPPRNFPTKFLGNVGQMAYL